jgi:hypothetical protein
MGLDNSVVPTATGKISVSIYLKLKVYALAKDCSEVLKYLDIKGNTEVINAEGKITNISDNPTAAE